MKYMLIPLKLISRCRGVYSLKFLAKRIFLTQWRARCFYEACNLIAGLLLFVFYMVSCMILSKTGMAQSNVHLSNQPKSILENNTSSSKSKESTGSFRITSPFGWRVDPITGRWALHQGVDIAGKKGSPILAPAEGLVCKVSQQAHLGNLLEIDHGNGYVSSYGHLERFAVREGDWVQEGQQIANLGNTGRSSGPHLHYELRYWGTLVNPAMHTVKVFESKGQLVPPSLTSCGRDASVRRPKIVF